MKTIRPLAEETNQTDKFPPLKSLVAFEQRRVLLERHAGCGGTGGIQRGESTIAELGKDARRAIVFS